VELVQDLQRRFDEYDFIIGPVAAGPAFRHNHKHLPIEMEGRTLAYVDYSWSYAIIDNACGNPALVVPAGRSANGLPIGIQIAAPHYIDRTARTGLHEARRVLTAVPDLLAADKERWGLAGDQLFVDMDLSAGNVPPRTRLALGSAVIEVSAEPHTGCQKFVTPFGLNATRFVNSPLGRRLQLRGINAKVVQGGRVRVGDVVRKLLGAPSE
jgi:hypothetical protein